MRSGKRLSDFFGVDGGAAVMTFSVIIIADIVLIALELGTML